MFRISIKRRCLSLKGHVIQRLDTGYFLPTSLATWREEIVKDTSDSAENWLAFMYALLEELKYMNMFSSCTQLSKKFFRKPSWW